MGRAGSIAAVMAASGILIAGAGVSVYAINTSLAAAAPQPVVVEAAASTPAPGDVVTAEDLQVSADDADLVVPDVTIPPAPAAPSSSGPQQSTSAQPSTAQTQKQKRPASSKSTQTRKAQTNRSARPAQQSQQRSISVASARTIAARAAKGRVIGMSVTNHNGFACFAVKVQRGDGSVVLAYIDRPTGAVIDWSLIRQAHTTPPPAPAPPAPAQPVAPAPETHPAEPTPTPTPTLAPSHTQSGKHDRPHSGSNGQNWQSGGNHNQNGSDD